MSSPYSVDRLMSEARRLAAEYRRATGRPLAVSGEIANYDAVRLLQLEPVAPGEGDCDALGTGVRAGRRIQIKGRAIFDERRSGHRVGQLKLDRNWDLLVLVLMNEDFETDEIHQIERADIEDALSKADGSRRRNRGALSVARLRLIGRLAWSRENGLEECIDSQHRAAGEG